MYAIPVSTRPQALTRRRNGQISSYRSSIPGSIHFNGRTEPELPDTCLEHVGGDVEIINSHGIEDLHGLAQLTSVGGNLIIWNNDELSSIELID